jgi:threonine synthase
MAEIQCTNCHQPYPDQGVPYRCSKCGGVYDFASPFPYESSKVQNHLGGIWRYRHTFNLPPGAPVVTLGEGNTPLIMGEGFGKQLAFKCEFLNPTGSFKDRGSALLVSFLLSRRVGTAVEDSSGNAGSSFAAYAARAGINPHIFIPDSASGPKRAQIEAYGAKVTRILGPRSNASDAVQREADLGTAYASHAYLPNNLPGYGTIAYELLEQLGEVPGSVIAPVGQGGLLLGIGRGFIALHHAGVVSNLPKLIGVQARACAPLWAISTFGAAGLGWVAEGPTLAEGIRVRHPLRGDALLRLVSATGGKFLAVDEEEIIPGRDQLARRGFYVEPTSAVIWGGLAQIADELSAPAVVVLTGSGYKTRD